MPRRPGRGRDGTPARRRRRAAVPSRAMSPEDALRAWGAYDLDDPFPLFAALRDRGPVHEVTLADGHRAWVVLDYDQARAALNDPRLSKNMQEAFSGGDVVAEGLPGPGVGAAHARRRPARPHAAATARVRCLHPPPHRGPPTARRGHRRRVARRRRAPLRRRSRRPRGDVRVPAPVHRDLRAARRRRGATATAWARASSRCCRRRRPRRHGTAPRRAPTSWSRSSRGSWRTSGPVRATTS